MLVKAASTSFSIQLIQDPLGGEGCKVCLVNADANQYKKLHETVSQFFADRDIVIYYKMVDPERQFDVTVDFSDHEYDCIDRNLLLEEIAVIFHCWHPPHADQRYYFPSEAAMSHLLNEWHDKIFQQAIIPYELKLAFNQLRGRELFQYLLNFLENRKHGIDEKFHEDIEVLLDYDVPFPYLNNKNEYCSAYPHNFCSMADLHINQMKRDVLREITWFLLKMKNPRNNPYANDHLFQLQMSLFKDICWQIVINKNETLISLFDKWLDQDIQYKNQRYSMPDFLKLRHKACQGWLWQMQSPDMFEILDSINKIANCIQPCILSFKEETAVELSGELIIHGMP